MGISKEASENILMNPAYLILIKFLLDKPDNSNGLYNRNIGKAQSVIYRQLQKLLNEGFIEEDKSDNAKRGAYQIIFQKLLDEYQNFLVNYYKINVKITKEKLSNKYFVEFLKTIIIFREAKTLYETFEKSMSDIFHYVSLPNEFELREKDRDYLIFDDFMKEIKKNLLSKDMVTDEVYHRLNYFILNSNNLAPKFKEGHK